MSHLDVVHPDQFRFGVTGQLAILGIYLNKAALEVYQAIRRDGTQKNVVATMQTREELYHYLDYHAYERKLDELFSQEKGKEKST